MIRRTLLLVVATAVLVTACGPDTKTPAPTGSLVAVAPTAATSADAPTGSSAPTPSTAATARPSPTPTPIPTASPIPTPEPTPIPWNTHRSKRFHYKMDYPPEWVVTPGTAKLADAYDGYDYPYVYVSRDTVSNAVSISRTVTADVGYHKSHYKAKVVSNKPIKLAGWSGRIITYTGKINGLKVTIQRIILGKGRVGYFLTMHGEAATTAADKAIFKAMYRTFKPT
jgi:hypothetical protein